MGKRAAIVIGVNTTGSLTPLRAAVTGAREVAQWLTSDGFDVETITDETKPLEARDIKNSVLRVLDPPGRYDKLVIYFAGHGYLNGTSETWLLSGAPDDPNEAIDQSLSAEFARSCSVRSVTFISDACRSVPQTLTGNRVSGVSIFPNRTNSMDVEIDRFFATRPGDAALEIPEVEASKRYVGLFTEILKNCHINPPPDLISKSVLEGEPAVVIPCRRLKETLPQLVDDAAQSKSILLTQLPQLRLECGEGAFLARAQFIKGATLDFQPSRGTSVGATPQRATHGSSLDPNDPSRLYYSPDVKDALNSPQFRGDINRFLTSQDLISDLRTGLQVIGKPVRRVLDGRRAIRSSDRGSFVIDLHRRHGENAHTVLVEFEDGSGGAIAILRDYVATVFANEQGIQSISYVPGFGSPRRDEYEDQRSRTERLRSIAAAAAKNGVLAVDRADAKKFGDLVRAAKRWDPTLGFYASLAYAEVGLIERVRSVAYYMRDDLQVDFFDVALLSGTMDSAGELFPFCPALNQSWMYLAPRGHRLPEQLERAGRKRMQSTWTTFTPEGFIEIEKFYRRRARE